MEISWLSGLVAILGFLGSIAVAVINAKEVQRATVARAKESTTEMFNALCEQQAKIISDLRGRIAANDAELQKLRMEMVGLRAENSALRERIHDLEEENNTLRARLKDMMDVVKSFTGKPDRDSTEG